MVDTNENLEEISVLLTKQRDLTGEIEKLVASISKTSIPNRTEVHKLEKQHQLDQLWQTFNLIDFISPLRA
jgi:indole-3-glycerol phosphate synthase